MSFITPRSSELFVSCSPSSWTLNT
jgi:hypothetical protein